jgi:PAS domain S-box-containing protein
MATSALTQLDYQTIVEAAPIMIWRAGPDGQCNYFNERWLAFTGRTLEQELGSGWAEGVHADDREFCMRTFLDALARRELFEMEYRLRRRDGAYRWVFDRGAPVLDRTGRFAGYIGSCVDVTERVAAQALAREHLVDLAILRGLVPICAWCRKVRDGDGRWTTFEAWVHEHSDAKFTHGMCPDCQRTHGPR